MFSWLFFIALIIVGHAFTLITTLPNTRIGHLRVIVPFITACTFNFIIWDFLIGPFISMMFLKTKIGKKFYGRMIIERSDINLE